MAAAAVLAALPAAALWALLPPLHPLLLAAGVLPLFGLGYLAGAKVLGVPQAVRWLGRTPFGSGGES
jgi:hypothetical protein